MPKTREFDAAEYLDSPEMIAEYLTEALETDDEVFIAKAIGTIARAGNGRRRRQRRRLPGKSLSRAQWQHPAGIRDNPQGAGSARRATGGEAACGLMHKPIALVAILPSLVATGHPRNEPVTEISVFHSRGAVQHCHRNSFCFSRPPPVLQETVTSITVAHN